MDNQYKEAPQQPPFTLGADTPSKEDIQQSLKEYHESLVHRVMEHNPEESYWAAIASHLIEDDGSKPPIYYWLKHKVETQPTFLLRNIDTVLSNREDIIKEDPRLLP